jgi:hypothetical protein
MNVLSVDLESWLHKYFIDFESSIKKEKDDGYICNATTDILEILEMYGVKTTFFVLGEIYEWHPWLIQKLRDSGHEICFHTYNHCRLHREEQLIKELEMGKDFIDEFGPKGFRAPEANIREEFFPILKDWGFEYDSSIYSQFEIFEPIDGFLEIPVSTYQIIKSKMKITYPRNLNMHLLMKEIPFGSGYFIGLLGKKIQWFIKKMNKNNIPANLFIHPWQVKEEPQRDIDVKMSLHRRVLTFPYNINRKETFEFLLKNNDFVPILELIKKEQQR